MEMSTPLEAAKKALGQMFIVGFEGLDLPDDTSAFFSQANIGGTILFAQNYDSPAQVAELTNQIQECRGELPLWISVDHEGGRVQRFKKGFTPIPPAQILGIQTSPKLVFEVAEIMAQELKAVGINLNFAPVADINTNPKNPVIGNRAFGATEEEVSKMITAIVRGHLTNGVQACIKHFPGHGDTSLDSHTDLPKVETDLATLQNREFKPFQKAFRSHCGLVMTAHILNPKLDPKYPATLSEITLQEHLRKQMRYSRVIVSDDMEMKAITDHFGAEEAPLLAVKAGCDMLIYRSEAAGRKAYAALLNALEDGRLSPDTVLQAEVRIREQKKVIYTQPYKAALVAEVSQKVGNPEHLSIVARLKQA